MNNEKLNEIYRNEGWGKLAEAAGFDPANTESAAREAFRFSSGVIDEMLAALEGAVGALEFSRDYHKDLGNEEQAFAQDRLDAALAAIAKAKGT